MKKTIFAILVASLMVLIAFSAISGSAETISTNNEDERGTIKVKITSITYRPDGATESISFEKNTMNVRVEAIQNEISVRSTNTLAPHRDGLLPWNSKDAAYLDHLYMNHKYKIRATIDSWISPADGKEYTFSGSTTVINTGGGALGNKPTECSLTMTGGLKTRNDANNLNRLPVNLQNLVTLLRTFFNNNVNIAGILAL